MAERELPKLETGVRFPSSALLKSPLGISSYRSMVKKVVGALVLILALAACSGVSRSEGPRGRAAAEGPSFNWEAPEPAGLYIDVTDLSSVDSSLPFTPVEPRLSGLLHAYVTDPAKVEANGMLLLVFYQDSTYGRIVVVEELNQLRQSDLENLLEYNSEPSSEAVFSLVKLDDGTEALVETVKTPSKDGLGTNSVELIAGNADITIFGPDGTFTSDLAIPVANLVLPKS
jgi:hypothetical protein